MSIENDGLPYDTENKTNYYNVEFENANNIKYLGKKALGHIIFVLLHLLVTSNLSK